MTSFYTIERSQKLLAYLVANPDLLSDDQQSVLDLIEVIRILEDHNNSQLSDLALRQENRHRVVLSDAEEESLEITVSRCRSLNQLIEKAKNVLRGRQFHERERNQRVEIQRSDKIIELQRLERLQAEREEMEREDRMRLDRERELQYVDQVKREEQQRRENRERELKHIEYNERYNNNNNNSNNNNTQQGPLSPPQPVNDFHQQQQTPPPPPPPPPSKYDFQNSNNVSDSQNHHRRNTSSPTRRDVANAVRVSDYTNNANNNSSSASSFDLDRSLSALKGSSRAYPQDGQRWNSPNRRPHELAGADNRTEIERSGGSFFALRPTGMNDNYLPETKSVTGGNNVNLTQEDLNPLIREAVRSVLRASRQEQSFHSNSRAYADNNEVKDDHEDTRQENLNEKAYRREVANVVRFVDSSSTSNNNTRNVPPSSRAERNFEAPPPPPPSNVFRLQQNETLLREDPQRFASRPVSTQPSQHYTSRGGAAQPVTPSSTPRHIGSQVYSDPYVPRNPNTSNRNNNNIDDIRVPLERPRTLFEISRASGVPQSRIRAANPKLQYFHENEVVPDHVNVYVPLEREDVTGRNYNKQNHYGGGMDTERRISSPTKRSVVRGI